MLILAEKPDGTAVKLINYFTNVVIKLCQVQHSVRLKLMDEINCDLCCCVRRRVHKNINTPSEFVVSEVFGNQTSGIDDRK